MAEHPTSCVQFDIERGVRIIEASSVRIWRSFLCAVAVGMALVLFVAPGAYSGSPVRSGAVAGGPIDTGPSTSCELAADCAAWLASGCNPNLAGLDPAVQTSIVDVSALAGKRTNRVFVVSPGAAREIPAGVVIGGFRIEFWTSSCKKIDYYVRDSSEDYFPMYIRTQSRFTIPARATWMTAAADDNVLIRWDLY